MSSSIILKFYIYLNIKLLPFKKNSNHTILFFKKKRNLLNNYPTIFLNPLLFLKIKTNKNNPFFHKKYYLVTLKLKHFQLTKTFSFRKKPWGGEAVAHMSGSTRLFKNLAFKNSQLTLPKSRVETRGD